MSLDYRSDPPRAPAPVPPEDAPSYDAVDFGRMYVLGTDEIDVPTPLDRMVENVLDWEHLPYVHPENFCASELRAQGPGWYRARFHAPPASSGEWNDVLVAVHPSRTRWFLALETGRNAGLHIHAAATIVDAEHVRVTLTFFLPEAPRSEAVRRALLDVYRKKLRLLYDQDIAMAATRHEVLRRLAARTTEVAPGDALGTLDALAATPRRITVRGQRFWVRVVDGAPAAFAHDCPHLGAPLPCPGHGGAPAGDVVTCPWHAYRFDVTTGRRDGPGALRLAAPPALTVVDGIVRLA